MNESKLLEQWFDTHECLDCCPYCIYGDDCLKAASCYGGEPHYPACADTDVSELINIDDLIKDIANGVA